MEGDPLVKPLLLVIPFLLAASSAPLAKDAHETGRVEIVSVPGATVRLDNTEVGVVESDSTLTLEEVPFGAHVLHVVLADSCDVRRRSFWLRPGVTEVFKARRCLRKADSVGQEPDTTGLTQQDFGVVVLETRGPECQLEIPGIGFSGMSSRGNPLIVRGVSPGSHTVRLLLEDRDFERTIEVHPATATSIICSESGSFEEAFRSAAAETGRIEEPLPDDSLAYEPPKVVKQVPPVYPETARLSELETVVMVEVEVDAAGRAVGARVVKGVDLVNEAAV
jgi:hypothetical protein